MKTESVIVRFLSKMRQACRTLSEFVFKDKWFTKRSHDSKSPKNQSVNSATDPGPGPEYPLPHPIPPRPKPPPPPQPKPIPPLPSPEPSTPLPFGKSDGTKHNGMKESAGK